MLFLCAQIQAISSVCIDGALVILIGIIAHTCCRIIAEIRLVGEAIGRHSRAIGNDVAVFIHIHLVAVLVDPELGSIPFLTAGILNYGVVAVCCLVSVGIIKLCIPVLCDVERGTKVHIEVLILQVIRVALCNFGYRFAQIVSMLVLYTFRHQAAPAI